MINTLFNKFCNIHPDFLQELSSLTENTRKKFEIKLKNERQEVNFLSTISEFKFAHFLELEKIPYDYEPRIENNKTPDFRITLTDIGICYFDIKRFNISDTDRKNSDSLRELCAKLKLIKKPYYLRVEQLSETLGIDINIAFQEIKEWLFNSNIKLYDKYIYNEELKFTVVKTEGFSDHVLYLFSSPNLKIHSTKIKSDIVKKIKWYKETIIEKGIPFFIGIDLRFDTLRDPEDYWSYFLGGSCEDIDTGAASFLLGEFYNDKELNGLTGILIRYNQNFYWLRNPRNKLQIEFKNVELSY